MKSIIAKFTFVFALLAFAQLNAQDVENISLTQTTGQFVEEDLTLTPGQYQFEIINDNVGKEVGFVIVPKGKYEAEHHIQAGYVKELVADGTSQMTGVVDLPAGEYEYFCPLNETPKYSLTVVDAKTVQLTQVPGQFVVEGLILSPGQYQFEIVNDNVGKEVGFVIVPKGKYEAEHHIQTGYVKELVADGTSKMTGVVDLPAGEYEYFCPLNETPKYTITVK